MVRLTQHHAHIRGLDCPAWEGQQGLLTDAGTYASGPGGGEAYPIVKTKKSDN